jgi:hypothetical protein
MLVGNCLACRLYGKKYNLFKILLAIRENMGYTSTCCDIDSVEA